MTYKSNYLAHYGILGMRWGVRKASPGALAGYNRTISKEYNQSGKTFNDLAKEISENRRRAVESQSLRRTDASELSNREIDELIARINKENTLNRLLTEREQAGKIRYDNIMRNLGSAFKVAGSAAALIATYYVIKEKKMTLNAKKK